MLHQPEQDCKAIGFLSGALLATCNCPQPDISIPSDLIYVCISACTTSDCKTAHVLTPTAESNGLHDHFMYEIAL
jgi:hypothetical protein